jgi:large subunit ribosomal protein L24
MNIKRDDTVIVLSGDDKGVKGKVIAVSPKEGKILVEKVNVIHKHVKPRKQGEAGGIVDAEGAIYASKVALYCDSCKKGVRTKTVRTVKDNGDKKIAVVCAKCGKVLREETIKGGKN